MPSPLDTVLALPPKRSPLEIVADLPPKAPGATSAQARANLEAIRGEGVDNFQPTGAERVANVAAGPARGFLDFAVSKPLQAAGRMTDWLGAGGGPLGSGDNILTRAGNAVEEAIPPRLSSMETRPGPAVGTNPLDIVRNLPPKAAPIMGRAERFGSEVLPEGLGQLGAAILPSGVVGRVAGAATTGLLGILTQAESGAQDAEQAGATPEQVKGAFGWNAPVGALDAIVPEGGKILASILKEGGTEGLQELASNLIAKNPMLSGYDPNRDWSQGVAESTLAGGILGGGVAGLDTVFSNAEPHDGVRTPPGPDPDLGPPLDYEALARDPEAEIQAVAEPNLTTDPETGQLVPVEPVQDVQGEPVTAPEPVIEAAPDEIPPAPIPDDVQAALGRRARRAALRAEIAADQAPAQTESQPAPTEGGFPMPAGRRTTINQGEDLSSLFDEEPASPAPQSPLEVVAALPPKKRPTKAQRRKAEAAQISEVVPAGRGARKATKEGAAKIELARQAMADAINAEYPTGAARADAIAAARENVQQVTADAQVEASGKRFDYVRGDRVELTGKTDGDFEEYRFVEGHRKGQTGQRLNPAAKAADQAKRADEYTREQEGFRNLRNKTKESEVIPNEEVQGQRREVPPVAATEPGAASPEVAPAQKQPWEMTKDAWQSIDETWAEIERDLTEAQTRRRVKFRYDYPGSAGPFLGEDYAREGVKKGDSFNGPFGRATVTSVGKPEGAGTKKPSDSQVYGELTRRHQAAVESALSRGLPVPPEVLADYPELAKKYAKNSAGGEPSEKLGESGRAKSAPDDGPGDASTPRLAALEASLVKKQAEFDRRLAEHMGDVKSANGQPLNDKRGGVATTDRWEKQNNALRSLKEGIAKTEAAIEKERGKIGYVAAHDTPQFIKDMVESGELVQWRKHPNTFFVPGVDKARLVWNPESGTIGHRYLDSVTKEQYPKFRDAANKAAQMARQMKNAEPAPTTEKSSAVPAPVVKDSLTTPPAPRPETEPSGAKGELEPGQELAVRAGASEELARKLSALRAEMESPKNRTHDEISKEYNALTGGKRIPEEGSLYEGYVLNFIERLKGEKTAKARRKAMLASAIVDNVDPNGAQRSLSYILARRMPEEVFGDLSIKDRVSLMMGLSGKKKLPARFSQFADWVVAPTTRWAVEDAQKVADYLANHWDSAETFLMSDAGRESSPATYDALNRLRASMKPKRGKSTEPVAPAPPPENPAPTPPKAKATDSEIGPTLAALEAAKIQKADAWKNLQRVREQREAGKTDALTLLKAQMSHSEAVERVRLAEKAVDARKAELKIEPPKRVRKAQERRAEAAKKGPKLRTFGVTQEDLEALHDYAVIGAWHVEQGARNFAAWSKRMLSDAVEELSPEKLRQIWDKIRTDRADLKLDAEEKPTEAPKPAQEPRPEPRGEAKGEGATIERGRGEESPEGFYSIRTADLKRDIREMTGEFVDGPERQSMISQIDAAEKANIPDSEVDRLVSRVMDDDATLTLREEGDLLYAGVKARRVMDDASAVLKDPKASPQDQQDATARYDHAFNSLYRYQHALIKAGTNIARALAGRRFTVNKAMDAVTVINRARMVGGGAPLSPEIQAKFKEMTAKYAEIQTKIVEAEKRAVEAEAAAEVQKARAEVAEARAAELAKMTKGERKAAKDKTRTPGATEGNESTRTPGKRYTTETASVLSELREFAKVCGR